MHRFRSIFIAALINTNNKMQHNFAACISELIMLSNFRLAPVEITLINCVETQIETTIIPTQRPLRQSQAQSGIPNSANNVTFHRRSRPDMHLGSPLRRHAIALCLSIISMHAPEHAVFTT